jgi:16S rRNA processing protein RimM
LSAQEWLEIAWLGRVRGLKGEIFADAQQAPAWFETLPAVQVRLSDGSWFGGEPPAGLRIAEARRQGDRMTLRFAELDSVALVEPLVNGCVCLAREQRPAAPDGEYWLTDLVGCTVYDRRTRRDAGTVTGWQELGPRIVLEVTVAGRAEPELMPFVRDICVVIDVAARRIEIEAPEGLLELNAAAPEAAPERDTEEQAGA